jgi:hypothetical protein
MLHSPKVALCPPDSVLEAVGLGADFRVARALETAPRIPDQRYSQYTTQNAEDNMADPIDSALQVQYVYPVITS